MSASFSDLPAVPALHVQGPDAQRRLAGDSGGLAPASGGQALAEQLPNAQFQVLEHCGHQLTLEKPQAVLDAFNALRVRGVRE